MLEDYGLREIVWEEADQRFSEVLVASPADAGGRGIRLTVTDGGEAVDMTEASVYLVWRNRATGTRGTEPFTAVDAENGEFSVFYPSALACGEGAVDAQIMVSRGDDTYISSRVFTIRVEPVLVGGAESGDGFSLFVDAIATYEDAASLTLDAAEEAKEAAEAATEAAEAATAAAEAAQAAIDSLGESAGDESDESDEDAEDDSGDEIPFTDALDSGEDSSDASDYAEAAAASAEEAADSATAASAAASEAADSAASAAASATEAAESATGAASSASEAASAAEAAEAALAAAQELLSSVDGADGDSEVIESVVAVTLDAGSDATATLEDGVLTLGIPRGADGVDGADGADGEDGADGADGYTPVRGTDYWTEDDVAEMKEYIQELFEEIENGSY